MVIIFPLDQDFLEKFLPFGQTFGFSPVLNLKEKLLHVNPNLLFYNKNKQGKNKIIQS